MRTPWTWSEALDRGRVALSLALMAVSGCEPAREAPRVERVIVVDDGGVSDVTTDLGFVVTLDEARLMLQDFQFATAGELHATRKLWDALISPAYAHPGHYEGGEIIGEANGRFVVDWLAASGSHLGTATLITGDYTSANFTLARARIEDGLDGGDPLLDHTALLAGSARRGEVELTFEFVVDSPEDRLLLGVPFEASIAEDVDGRLGFRLLPQDPLGSDTLFDQVDFSELDGDGDGRVVIGPESTGEAHVNAYNQLRRRLQTHNHYAFVLRGTDGNEGGSR